MNTYIFRFTVLFALAVGSTGYGLTFLGDCNLTLANLSKNPQLRSLASVESLKIVTYNFENFKVPDVNRPVSQDGRKEFRDKDLALIIQQRKLVEDWSPDILAGEEIFDEISLNALKSEIYAPVFIEGNEEESHIGFLIKKDLPFYVSVETHKNEMWLDSTDKQTHKLFTRDLPVLLVRTSPEGAPAYIIFGTHGKAQRDRKGDPGSRKLIRAQGKRTAEIIEGYRTKYPNAGILGPGDYNVDTRWAPELFPLRANMRDPFDIMHVPLSERVTHIFFPPKGPPEKSQLDNIFVSQNLRDQVISARVIHYLDEDGKPKSEPKSLEERKKNGSDHDAVEIVISTKNQLAF